MADITQVEPRQRGPNFPSGNVERGLEIAKKIHEAARKNPVFRDQAAQYLGYANARNGTEARTVAIPAHYGLVEEAGKDKLRVSYAAEGILYPKSGVERYQLLKAASERPKIFKEMIDRFGMSGTHGIPADATLKPVLIREWGFSEEAASIFIKSFRETLDYVRSAEVHNDAEPQKKLDAKSDTESEMFQNHSRKASDVGNMEEVDGSVHSEFLAAPLSIGLTQLTFLVMVVHALGDERAQSLRCGLHPVLDCRPAGPHLHRSRPLRAGSVARRLHAPLDKTAS